MTNHPDILAELSNFVTQINNHLVKVGDLGSLFEVFLGGGLALAGIPKVESLITNFLQNKSNDTTSFLKATEKSAEESAEIFLKRTKDTVPEDFYGLRRLATSLQEKVNNWKKILVIRTVHNFFILGIFCFFMLIFCAVEGVFEQNREFVFFKNYLFAFNLLFFTYYFFEFFTQEKRIRERIFYHLGNIMCFLFIALTYTFLFHYNIQLVIILVLIIINLILPFLLTAAIPFYLIRLTKSHKNYKEIIQAKNSATYLQGIKRKTRS